MLQNAISDDKDSTSFTEVRNELKKILHKKFAWSDKEFNRWLQKPHKIYAEQKKSDGNASKRKKFKTPEEIIKFPKQAKEFLSFVKRMCE